MKITKTRLKQIIKEELNNVAEAPADDELYQALQAYDNWKEDQVARDVMDYNIPEEYMIIKWMSSRNRLGGRKYAHLIAQIADEYGFNKPDVMRGLKMYGSKVLQRKGAEALKGYRRKRVRGVDFEESFKQRPGDALHLRMSDRLKPRNKEETGMSSEELEARRNEEFRQKILQAVDDLINQRLSKYDLEEIRKNPDLSPKRHKKPGEIKDDGKYADPKRARPKRMNEELTRQDKTDVKKMVKDELEKLLKKKDTKDQMGEIVKKIMKKLYKDLSLEHPYIIDRIKI